MSSAEDRISFGPKETDNVPPAWAASMLTYIKEHYPLEFARALTHTLGIDMPETARRARRTTPAPGSAPAPLTIPGGQHAKAS